MAGGIEQREPSGAQVTAFGGADQPAPANGDHVQGKSNQIVVGGKKDRECPEPEGLEVGLGGVAQDLIGQRPLASPDDDRRVGRRHVATEPYGARWHGQSLSPGLNRRWASRARSSAVEAA